MRNIIRALRLQGTKHVCWPDQHTSPRALADTGARAAMQIPDGHSKEAARREGTQFQITSFLKPKRSSSELGNHLPAAIAI